jgi:hypothetical protein
VGLGFEQNSNLDMWSLRCHNCVLTTLVTTPEVHIFVWSPPLHLKWPIEYNAVILGLFLTGPWDNLEP